MPRARRPVIATVRSEKQVTAAVRDAAALYGIKLERRNVGLAFDARGRAVQFNERGDADYESTVPHGPNRGRRLAVEIKRSDFDPNKLVPASEKYQHFWEQVAKLRRINADGGFAFWVRDGGDAARVFARLARTPGLTVDIDNDGYCYLDWDD